MENGKAVQERFVFCRSSIGCPRGGARAYTGLSGRSRIFRRTRSSSLKKRGFPSFVSLEFGYRRERRFVYLRAAKSLGAAHWFAQWTRWKTVYIISIAALQLAPRTPILSSPAGPQAALDCSDPLCVGVLTLLNAVLLCLALLLLLLLDALDAVLVVVLGRGAFLGVGALCNGCQPPSHTCRGLETANRASMTSRWKPIERPWLACPPG